MYLEDHLIKLWGSYRKKVSAFLYHHLKSIMQQGKSYIRDSEEELSFKDQAVLFQLQQMWWDCTTHWAGLNALNFALENQKEKQIPTSVYLKWMDLFWVKIILNILIKFTKRPWELLLVLNPLHPTLAFGWTK